MYSSPWSSIARSITGPSSLSLTVQSITSSQPPKSTLSSSSAVAAAAAGATDDGGDGDASAPSPSAPTVALSASAFLRQLPHPLGASRHLLQPSTTSNRAPSATCSRGISPTAPSSVNVTSTPHAVTRPTFAVYQSPSSHRMRTRSPPHPAGIFETPRGPALEPWHWRLEPALTAERGTRRRRDSSAGAPGRFIYSIEALNYCLLSG